MPKAGYLTATEYKAIRKLLGFTLEEAKDFHKVQNISTIKRWENGYSKISELACDKITDLLKKINWTIAQALEKVDEMPEDSEVVLITYPESCIRKFAVGFQNLPANVHNAMIARLYSAIREKGIACGVVEFNVQDYLNFLAINKMQDNQASRSAWAGDYRSRLIIQ